MRSNTAEPKRVGELGGANRGAQPQAGAAITLLLVEDNPADVRRIAEVLAHGPVAVELSVVGDGEEAMAFFLRREGDYRGTSRLAAVLLDFNLPGTEGRDVLAELKGDPALRSIPVVVLTSRADADVARCYELHANAYVTTQVDLDGFVDTIRSVERFWLETATLPPAGTS